MFLRHDLMRAYSQETVIGRTVDGSPEFRNECPNADLTALSIALAVVGTVFCAFGR